MLTKRSSQKNGKQRQQMKKSQQNTKKSIYKEKTHILEWSHNSTFQTTITKYTITWQQEEGERMKTSTKTLI